jgi:hypothetical protein
MAQVQNNNNYARRPRPNFVINFDHLTERQKILHRMMREQEANANSEVMNKIYNDELIYYALNQNPAINHPRVNLRDAILACQEVVIEIQTWRFENWKNAENKEYCKSLLEASFDTILNILHETATSPPEITRTIYQIMYDLDMLYFRMLRILNIVNMATPMDMMGLINPLRQATQSPLVQNNQLGPTFVHQQPVNINNMAINNQGPQQQMPITNEPTFAQNRVGNINNTNNNANIAQQMQRNAYNGPTTAQMQQNRMNPNLNNQNEMITEPSLNVGTPRRFQQNARTFNSNNLMPNAPSPNMRQDSRNMNNETPNSPFLNLPNVSSPFSSPNAFNVRRKFDDSALKIVNTIKSWPNKFDGTQGNFMHHLSSWLEKTNEDITPEMVLKNIEYLLEGEALKWHKLFGKCHQGWYEYAKGMQNFLNRGRSDHEIEAEFEHSNHNQKQDEDFITYLTRIQTMANKLTMPPSHEKLYERIKRGLHADYLICKITAQNLSDLMAKCAEYESTKMAKSTEKAGVYDPFGWIKDRVVHMDAQPAIQDLQEIDMNYAGHRPKFNNNWHQYRNQEDKWKPQSQFNKPRINNKVPFQNKFWNYRDKNVKSGDNNDNALRHMPENDSDDDNPPELTRGIPRPIDDADKEYLNEKAVDTSTMIRNLKMNENEFLAFQQAQICTNCHVKGHTIDRCPDAQKGVWYEHCKRCYKPNAKIESCAQCKKN